MITLMLIQIMYVLTGLAGACLSFVVLVKSFLFAITQNDSFRIMIKEYTVSMWILYAATVAIWWIHEWLSKQVVER